jgi:hypothetical protein
MPDSVKGHKTGGLMTTTDPNRRDEVPPALPWWATTELVAGMIVATLQAVVLACLQRDFESFSVAVGLAVATLATSIVARMAPHALSSIPKRVSKALRWPCAVARQIQGVLWSPFIILLAGISLIATGGPYLYRIIGIWLVLIGVGSASERKGPSVTWFFEDDFSLGLGAWNIVSGCPSIDLSFGKPAPSLNLRFVGSQSTHSFACARDVTGIADGEIECDLYIPTGSVAGIVFRGNVPAGSYYIAQLSADPDFHGGLFKSSKRSTSWQRIGTRLKSSTGAGWRRIKVSFNGSQLMLFEDGELSAYARDRAFKSGCVGIFNRQGQVYVDNFRAGSTTRSVAMVVHRLFGIE